MTIKCKHPDKIEVVTGSGVMWCMQCGSLLTRMSWQHPVVYELILEGIARKRGNPHDNH